MVLVRFPVRNQSNKSQNRPSFTQALLMMSGFDDSKKITKSLHYYTNNGKILNPRKGVYSCSHGDSPPVSLALKTSKDSHTF